MFTGESAKRGSCCPRCRCTWLPTLGVKTEKWFARFGERKNRGARHSVHARQSRVPVVEVTGRRERSCSCDGGCRETESHLAAPFRYNGTLAPINRLPLLLSLPPALPSLFPASTTSFSASSFVFLPSSRPRKCRVKQEKMANPL